MEETKNNSCPKSQKKNKNNDKEIIEMHIGRPNPAFNLVSIKARYRLHLIKQNYSKNDYNDYIRRCKNMYSISSKMSSDMNMSDIYYQEKKGISNILNIFKKIDDKVSSNRIRLTKYKKDNSKKKYLKEKSLSAVNIFEDKSKLANLKMTPNKFNNIRNEIKFKTEKISLKNSKDNMFNLNNIKKMNSTFSSNFKSNFSNMNINNNNINIDNNNQNNKNICLNKTKNSTFEEKKNFGLKFKPLIINKKASMNKSPEYIENDRPKKVYNLNGLFNFKSKQSPISAKSDGITITNYGGIVFNDSFFRKKTISNFLYNNVNLPIIYSSKY